MFGVPWLRPAYLVIALMAPGLLLIVLIVIRATIGVWQTRRREKPSGPNRQREPGQNDG